MVATGAAPAVAVAVAAASLAAAAESPAAPVPAPAARAGTARAPCASSWWTTTSPSLVLKTKVRMVVVHTLFRDSARLWAGAATAGAKRHIKRPVSVARNRPY